MNINCLVKLLRELYEEKERAETTINEFAKKYVGIILLLNHNIIMILLMI